ncbi:MAG: serine hydrolase [Gemmatimonadota bacterium]|nr:MAG: serine hydrolase [Gemmatimonadota bacterium]
MALYATRSPRYSVLRRLIPLAAAGIALACLGDTPPGISLEYVYEVPQETGDGWLTGHLSDHGFDLGPIRDLFALVLDGSYPNVHSVLIIRDGVLVLEEYFPGYTSIGEYVSFDRETLHSCYSVTKSVNSALIGIAIDRGLISDTQQKISSFLAEYADIFTDPDKDLLRLDHLLSMTAGLDWDELTYPYVDPNNSHYWLRLSDDPIRYTLEQPAVAEPGTSFVYNSGLSIALGRILENVAGLAADEFAEVYLFAPLSVSEYTWGRMSDGETLETGGGLSLRPRDMAKFGQLYLNGGRWGDVQVVSEGWVTESIQQQAPDRGYGYQWWLTSFSVDGRVVDSYTGIGWGGQYVFVIPELDMVVVFTGGNYDQSISYAYVMLGTHILLSALPQTSQLRAAAAGAALVP